MGAESSLDDYFTHMEHLLADTANDRELFDVIVNAPFHNKLHTTNLDLGIVVLLMVNKKGGTIDRIALSDTEPARWAVKMTPVPFHEIKVPAGNKSNLIGKAIKTKQYQKTTDWKFLFTPALTAEAARFNQAGAGIACSYVYPLVGARDGGAMIFSFYQPPDNIKKNHRDFMKDYSEMTAKALKKKR